jgi:two-component system, OmpR family, alkaline phosphatase synthesis response regulator PhoP
MRQNILIADDEPELVELVRWILSKEGYQVHSAANSLEAINRARELLPDLIVLDLVMPDLDGTSACEILRRLPSTASIPVLMVTGCATQNARFVALNSGVSAYMTKPFTPSQLVSKVHELLAVEYPVASPV